MEKHGQIRPANAEQIPMVMSGAAISSFTSFVRDTITRVNPKMGIRISEANFHNCRVAFTYELSNIIPVWTSTSS